MNTLYHVAYWKSLRAKNMRTFQFRWVARLFAKLCEFVGYRVAYVDEIVIPHRMPMRPRTRELCRIFFICGVVSGCLFTACLTLALEQLL